MRVKYVGSDADGVEVRPWHDPDGGRVVVKPGEQLVTSADHAEALLLQGPELWKRGSAKEPIDGGDG